MAAGPLESWTGRKPDGQAGVTCLGKFGVVGLDVLGKDLIVDGMNEKGLTAGLVGHPGFAGYHEYDPARRAESMSPRDVGRYLPSSCATVKEARAAMARVRVVPQVEPALGFSPPLHSMVAEPSGKAIAIEFPKGELQVCDAPLGVITNAPAYDRHETNLRDHINLSAVAIPDRKILDLDLKPLGVGSGMIGPPGDFTPPARFARAVTFTRSVRFRNRSTSTHLRIARRKVPGGGSGCRARLRPRRPRLAGHSMVAVVCPPPLPGFPLVSWASPSPAHGR